MTAAAALGDCDSWLPACFLSKERTVHTVSGLGRGGPIETFPYEVGMFRSEVTSPVETMGSEASSEDEFFASFLTHRLTLSESRKVPPLDLYKSPEGLKGSGGSPRSALGGIGSWSGRSSNGSDHSSPMAKPFESREDTLGLIYAAAGQVARLERNGEDPLQAALNGQWRAVAKPSPNQQAAHLQNLKADFYADQQMKRDYLAAVRQANLKAAALIWEHQLQNLNRIENMNLSAWPPLQQARASVKPNYPAVQVQRKESAGTGVFIPRCYRAPSSVPPRKRTVASCALVPAKVVQALNSSIETMSACTQTRFDHIPCSASISPHSYDVLMVRRRALFDQQQRSMVRNDASKSLEACLPQEWSY